MKVLSAALIILAGITLLQPSFAATIYKGIDAQGNIVFSDKPLRHVKVIEKVEINIPDKGSETVLAKKPTTPAAPTNNQAPTTEQTISQAAPSSLTERFTQRRELAEQIVSTYDALQKAEGSLKEAQQLQAVNDKECENRRHRLSKFSDDDVIKACQNDVLSVAQERVDRLESKLKSYEKNYSAVR